MRTNQENSKTKSSVTTAFVSLLYTFANGIMGLVVTQMLITKLGSDFNGINSAAIQVVNVLLIFESGYSLSTSVALFSPLSHNDRDAINSIISTAKRAFLRIGCFYFLGGFGFSLVYSLIVKSSLNTGIIFTIMIMAIIPSGLNLIFATQYTVLYQANQKEYLIYFFKLVSVVLGQILVIITCIISNNILVIRSVMMMPYLIAILIIISTGRRDFTVNKGKTDISLIRGTGDLLIQRIVGVIYTSMPIILISLRIGTITASVYGIYASVTALMRSMASALILSPRMSLGALLAEDDRIKTANVFKYYEAFVLHMITIMTVIYYAVIMNFIKLYSSSFGETSYYNDGIAIMLGLIFWIECLHTPSGVVICMAGMFSAAKKIQIVAGIVLIAFMTIGLITANLYYMIFAVLIAAICLAVLEVGYVHEKMFKHTSKFFLMNILFSSISAILSIIIIQAFSIKALSYPMLFFKVLISCLIATSIEFGILYFHDKMQFVMMISFIKKTFKIIFK